LLTLSWAFRAQAQVPRPPPPSPPYGNPSPWAPSPPMPGRTPLRTEPWPDEMPRPIRRPISPDAPERDESHALASTVSPPPDRQAGVAEAEASELQMAIGALSVRLGSRRGEPADAGVGLVAAASGVRTAEPTTAAWSVRAGFDRRSDLSSAEAEGAASFGFIAPLGWGGGPFARLGAAGGALSGAAGRAAYLTLPSAEIGYQSIRKGSVLFDAGLRAGSILAGGVDPLGAPASSLPLAAMAGAFAVVSAPASGLAFEARALHADAGERGTIGRARASGCWFHGMWGLCVDVGYERIGRGPKTQDTISDMWVGGISFGLGALQGGDAARP
jgi:hypothetical protein